MLVILADDLTGTLDSAAPFAGRGLVTEVVLHPDALDEALAQAPDVLAVNLRSREITASEAARATAEALKRLPVGVRIFKKVDSRLKGNIVAELDAMSFERALVAPAIPDFGRLVVGGHVRGFGIETPIAVAEKLGPHAARAHIPDTSSQDEMLTSLKLAENEGFDLLIGARGLADSLAQTMTSKEPQPLIAVPEVPTLIVVGSRDPITVKQVDDLRSRCVIDYVAAPGGKCDTSPARSREMVVVVQATEGPAPVQPLEMSANLANMVVPAFTDRASTLVLTGGATAEAVLEKMGILRFRLLGECMPGMGLAIADGRHIVTKSGGFGQPDTLLKLVRQILRKAA